MKDRPSNSRADAGPKQEAHPGRPGLRRRATLTRGLLTIAAAFLLPATGRALPSFARQMNMQCVMCHTEFPELTQFGRQFKLTGYTLSADQSQMPPLAIMVQPSFTQTAMGLVGGAAPGFGNNNNWALTQASVFYGGRLFGPYAADLFGKEAAASFFNKIGVFSQMTYDGVGKAWSWDNTEFRYADTGTIAGKDAIYGVYWNNNPTLQDPWNSTPAWGFPFTGSGLAPGPAAGTLIDGGLAQQVGGAGAYLWLDNTYYIDVAGYQNLSYHLQSILGVDPEGETQIAGTAPYWRFAIEKMVGQGRWEFGTFGLAADTYPGRDNSAGKDRTLDIGLDSQYQVSAGPGDFTAMFTYIHERQTRNASYALGNTSNPTDSLWTVKATANYLYDKTFGITAQYFRIGGGTDAILYGDSMNGSPTSDGIVLQADYLPFNKNGGPSFWPRSNVKFSLQYVIYNRFDGSANNIDGAGRSARDNNTI